MTRFFAVAILSVVLFSSCHFLHGKRIKGNGNVITQPRNLSGFSAVNVSSAINLYIKQDSSFSVKVVADDNLQVYVIVEMDGNTLRVREKDNTNLDATGKIKVYVSAPAFKSLNASGACNIIGENLLSTDENVEIDVTGASEATLELKALKISAGMTGASRLELRGQTKDLSLEGSGASHAKCFELLSENTKVDISGASHAEVFASVLLDAHASGASGIRYKGNATVSQEASGASSVKKEE